MLRELWDLAENKVKFKAAQFENALYEQKRHYEAAGHGRRTEKWYRRSAGPAADQQRGLLYLRGFSRDLVRNNPHAQRAITVIATNTVGSGIIPAFKGVRSKAVKKLWQQWAGTDKCDFNGHMNFYGLQEQIMRAVAESGDALVVRRYTENSPVGFDLQVLESDFLDHNKTINLSDGGFIVQGVEFDRSGRRRGYWLFEEHPNEIGKFNSAQSRFISKDLVIHIFEVLRPGQVRGIPMGVSAFIRIKDFDEFQDAQLHQQKVAACFVGFVTNTNPTPVGGLTREDLDITDRLEPGLIQELPHGRDMKFSQPPTTSGTDLYSLTVLRSIASGYNVTYESLTNDYSQVNFSSGRMGWLEFSRSVTSWQNKLMITMFCQRVYDWFEQGIRVMEGIKPKLDVTWTTPRREMIDPLKEGAATNAQIKAGLKSRQEGIRELGYDPEDVNAEIKEDMESADAINALFSTDVKYRPEAQAPRPSTATTKPQTSKN